MNRIVDAVTVGVAVAVTIMSSLAVSTCWTERVSRDIAPTTPSLTRSQL